MIDNRTIRKLARDQGSQLGARLADLIVTNTTSEEIVIPHVQAALVEMVSVEIWNARNEFAAINGYAPAASLFWHRAHRSFSKRLSHLIDGMRALEDQGSLNAKH